MFHWRYSTAKERKAKRINHLSRFFQQNCIRQNCVLRPHFDPHGLGLIPHPKLRFILF